MVTIYDSFNIIKYLSILNLAFLLQHIVSFIFIKKLGRFYQFPVLLHFTDSILLVSSLITIDWVQGLSKGLTTEPPLEQEQL